jgi:hypothetical protein
MTRLGNRLKMSHYPRILKAIEFTSKRTGSRGIVEINHTHRQVLRQAIVSSDVKNTIVNSGKTTIQKPYMGFFFRIFISRKAISHIKAKYFNSSILEFFNP